MKILVLGSGGREHALSWKLRHSQLTEEIYCAPGNAGIGQEAECLPVDLSNPEEMLDLAKRLQADLTVVGPEAPLAAGVVDVFEKAGLAIIGPTRAATCFESSKVFAKQFMHRRGIPTARFATTQEEAEQTLDNFMRRKILGRAGDSVVIEEALVGEELSFIVLTDGRSILPLPPSQDHKPLLDHDEGPNTGGMGAFSDDVLVNEGLRAEVLQRIVHPTLAGMAEEGILFRGFLYFGLMITREGPKVLEYNVRLGDPEAQPILMLLRCDLVELFSATHQGTLGAHEAHWSPNPAVCVVLASQGYPGKPVVGKTITGYDLAETMGGVKVFHAGTAFRDHQLITTGGRVLGVTATGEDLSAAIQQVYAAVSKISFEGMQYRHDIGAKAFQRHASLLRRSSVNPATPAAQNSQKYC